MNPEYAKRIENRTRKLHRRRGEYVVPGPDYIWSIDAHLKPEPYGIEIYAAIDAHSRLLLWLYIGITARTQISVLYQYVTTLQGTGRKPLLIRSDRGVETTMLGDCHLALSQKDDPELELEDVYIYGTSVHNQRIEGFWENMTCTPLNAWITFFRLLAGQKDFRKSEQADRIAVLTVYIPIIRKEIYHFFGTWNAHLIRKQPHRPYHISGVPNILHYWPEDGIETYSTEPNAEILNSMMQDLQDFDPDEYLPPVTLQWCTDTLRCAGFDLENMNQETEIPGTRERAHFAAYKLLKAKLKEHIKNNAAPILTETPHPLGGINWNPTSTALAGSVQEGCRPETETHPSRVMIEEQPLDSEEN